MPSCNTYHLTWVSLTLGVGYLGCSSKAQTLLLTLDEGYLLMAGPPDLERRVAPLSPPAPVQPTKRFFQALVTYLWASQVVQLIRTSANATEASLIPGLGRFPGGRNGNPLQCFCLENPMDWGAWWATVHGIVELDTTEHTCTHISCICGIYPGKRNNSPKWPKWSS